MSTNVDRLAADMLGAPPAADPAAAGMPPQPPVPPSADPRPTAEEVAQAKGGPETEADKADAEAVVYKVAFGDAERELTPQQIRSTFERYAALNHRHSQTKPILQLAEQLQQATGAPPEAIARLMADSLRQMAGQKNVQMGGDGQPSGRPGDDAAAAHDPFRAWEDENAASLPPGYKDMASKMAVMEGLMAKQQALLAGLLQASRGAMEHGQQAMQGAQSMQANATRQQIINNLTSAQQELGLPDEAVEDFVSFMADRGYSFEDFVDPDLTRTVVRDFASIQSSPELERLRQIAQRRQAYTGALSPSPAGGGAATGAPADSRFKALTDSVMASRMI